MLFGRQGFTHGPDEPGLPEFYVRGQLALLPALLEVRVRRLRWFRGMAIPYFQDGPSSVPLIAALIGDIAYHSQALRGSRAFTAAGEMGDNTPPFLKALSADLETIGFDPINHDQRRLREPLLLPRAEIGRYRREQLFLVSCPPPPSLDTTSLL